MLHHLLRIIPLVSLSAAPVALAGNPIQWGADLQKGIATAQRNHRPLLLYVPGDSDGDESDLEDAQDQTFRDDLVRRYVHQRFDPVRLSRSNPTERLLERLGVSSSYGLFLLAVTPEGELLARIKPASIASREQLLRALARAFRAYRTDLFEDELRESLTADESEPAELGSALKVIRNLLVLESDEAVASLLGRTTARSRSSASTRVISSAIG